jgi:hypothetical protein
MQIDAALGGREYAWAQLQRDSKDIYSSLRPIVRLRFAIPLTILLLAATSYVSGILPFNAYYVLVGATAIWAAYDSHRLGIQRFDSSLALPPVGVLIALAVLWPFTFPAYLKLRYRIQHGEIGTRVSRAPKLGWLIFGGVVVGAGVVAFALFSRSPAIRSLTSLMTDVSTEFGVPVAVSVISGRHLALKIYNPPRSADSVSVEWAKSIARFARDRYAGAGQLDSVAVSLVDQRQQGAITVTNERERYAWSVEQLQDSAAAPEDDAFARSFLENVRSRDVAGAAQLQPGSDISSKWTRIAALSSSFPKGSPLEIRPVRWVLYVDSTIVARKLTYRIESPTDTTQAQIWLVDVAGRRYVNTFRWTRGTK